MPIASLVGSPRSGPNQLFLEYMRNGGAAPLLARLLVAAVLLILAVPTTFASETAAVWFSPDSESPDFLKLFTQPQLWPKARGQINVIKFTPPQLSITNSSVTSGFQDLSRVDAFRKLREWGIDIAIEAPAIKEWDCSGGNDTTNPQAHGDAKGATIDYIKNVFTAGASVEFIAMDEPLASGAGPCRQSIDETAARTATYAKALLTDKDLPSWAPRLTIGDIEPYPSKTVAQLKRWTQALKQNGLQLAFFHLDVDIHDVDVRGGKLNVDADLQSLKVFFHTENIPFGMILWSGHDPEASDFSYYRHVMNWAKHVRAAIGKPDQLILQSWVRRSSINCTAGSPCSSANNWGCSLADPISCGKLSVPINLPENDPTVFSHTRLVVEALTIFE